MLLHRLRPAVWELPRRLPRLATAAAGRTSGQLVCPQLARLVSHKVPVPAMGDSISEGTLSSWHKAKGQYAKADEVVATLDTDKVSVEVHAPVSGVVTDLLVKEGDIVVVGSPLFVVDDAAHPPPEASGTERDTPLRPDSNDADARAKGRSQVEKRDDASAEIHVHSREAPKTCHKNSAPNAAALISAESSGSSMRTRSPVITVGYDSRQNIFPPSKKTNAAASQSPTVRTTRTEPMSRMRQRVAERLKGAQNAAASLTTFNECDMAALIAMRKDTAKEMESVHGVKLGFVSAFLFAASRALLRAPMLNAHIAENGKDIVHKDYVDVSVAVAAPTGLLVPVIRDCHTKSLAQLEKDIATFAAQARTGKIALEDMAGGNFTISNGGVFGSLFGTPIINPPQSSILGLHSIKDRPVVINGKIEIRPMMYLALTYDHRIVDGREAVTFLNDIRKQIEDPRRMLLEV